MAREQKHFLPWLIILLLFIGVPFLTFGPHFFYLNSSALTLTSTCPNGTWYPDSGDYKCCTPNCTGKVCGSDGCGGSCGTCLENQNCDSNNQCVLNNTGGGTNTDGGGTTTTTTDNTTTTTIPTSTPTGGANNTNDSINTVNQIVTETIPEVIKNTTEAVKTTTKEVQKAIDTPQGSIATKAISTTGVVVATAQVASVAAFSPMEIFLALTRLFGLFFAALGLKKRIKPWGVVYDSVTKQPLDPAYVVLRDLKGKDIASAITDLDGRYGFLVSPGVYQMSVNKTNYIFPSKNLAGKTSDELYDELYFSENIEIKKEGDTILKNIPMDPLKFDWNEFAKKDKRLMKFYSKLDIIMRQIFDLFFIVGFFVAIIAYFAAPYPYNLIVLFIYIFLLFLRLVGVKPKAFGRITDIQNGNPLSFAVLRVITPGSEVEVAHKVADKYGRYYCLVPKGEYYIKVEKKNEDGSYELVHLSTIIDASKTGIIKNNFKVNA